MFRTQNQPLDVLNRLKGKKHLILGNHDRGWLNKIEAADFFKSVENYTEINHYRPVTFDQLVENNDLFKKSVIDVT